MLFVLPLLLSGLSGETSESPLLPELRHCDVVVVGEVTSVQRSLESAIDALPMLPLQEPGDLTAVTRVRITVSEVIWGEGVPKSLEFLVFASLSLFRDDYHIGQHILVGLIWGEDVLGGHFWLFSDDGRLLRSDDGWVARDGSSVESISPLKDAFSAVAPVESIKSADIIVIARVRNVAREHEVDPSRAETRYTRILLDDLRPLAGEVPDSVMIVTQITSGDYWPEWRDAVPFLAAERGKTYCFALKRIPSGYAIVNGINGVWEVRGDDLYFAGRSRTGLTVPIVRQIRMDEQ